MYLGMLTVYLGVQTLRGAQADVVVLSFMTTFCGAFAIASVTRSTLPELGTWLVTRWPEARLKIFSPPQGTGWMAWGIAVDALAAAMLVLAARPGYLRARNSRLQPTASDVRGFIFLSYKREDSDKASTLTDVLRLRGYEVWFDREIQCGQRWHAVIDEKLAAASCVIVLWSRLANDSPWVRHEASTAIARDVYAPCRVEESVSITPPYNVVQAADLFDWSGQQDDAGIMHLEQRIAQLLPKRQALVVRSARAVWSRKLGILSFLFGISSLLFLLWQTRESVSVLDQLHQTQRSYQPLDPIGFYLRVNIPLNDERVADYIKRLRGLRQKTFHPSMDSVVFWYADGTPQRIILYKHSNLSPQPESKDGPATKVLSAPDFDIQISKKGAEPLRLHCWAWNEGGLENVLIHDLNRSFAPLMQIVLDINFDKKSIEQFIHTTSVQRIRESQSFIGLADLVDSRLEIWSEPTLEEFGFFLGSNFGAAYRFSDDRIETELDPLVGGKSIQVIHISRDDLRLPSLPR
jgi:hypothetical protein